MVRVLSLDGGGVRGIFQARVLAELEAITGAPTSDLFDLVAGTAAGAVLALGLALPGPERRSRFSAADLLRLYIHRARELFPRPDPVSRLRRFLRLERARHPGDKLLAERLGDAVFGDALVDLLIPTFDLRSEAPLFLRSAEFPPGSGPRMSEVALAAAAAPTHFPGMRVELGHRARTLTHGGVVANNPAAFAYAAAIAGAEPSDVALVSLGSGKMIVGALNGTSGGDPGWPLGAAASFELHLEASSEAHHQLLDSLLAATSQRERYWRLQPELDPHVHHHGHEVGDDPAVLADLADRFVSDSRHTLNEIADRLIAA